MKTRNNSAFKASILIAAASLSLPGISHAQESAYADLNACTKDQQIKMTAKGALTGALAGFGGALLSGKKDDALKVAAVGAAAGGVAGFATAYYTAIDSCYKLNPNWVPESNITRDPSKSYPQVLKENQYSKKEGIKVLAKEMRLPDTVKPGETLPIVSTFDVMTPDGAQADIVIERKLFAVVDGKETMLPTPFHGTDSRTIEAGRSRDTVNLPIGPETKAGSVYRVEFSVNGGGKPANVVSKTVTVS